MSNWVENGYEMTKHNGETYVVDRGVKYKFSKWHKVGWGKKAKFVPVVKVFGEDNFFDDLNKE